MISCFEHIKAPTVLTEIDIYEFIEVIKSPDIITQRRIEKIRSYYHNDKETYDSLKAKLPCYALNFRFDKKRRTINIIEPTGLIYLDVDYNTNIDLNNPHIFATWLSISGRGRGILVKVDNLTTENFRDTYIAISKELNINTDIRAAKPTQPTIQSYDKDIYLNDDALTWLCDIDTSLENTPTTLLNTSKKRKGNNAVGENLTLRFDNYNEADFKGQKYLYFKDEKILKSKVVIPKKINSGSRNSVLSAIAYQIRALNPYVSFNHLKAVIESINIHCCIPTLKDKEIHSISKKTMEIENCEPLLNSPRRFLFNPKFNLSRKEKMQIVNTKNGQVKSELTIKEIGNCIDKWDIKTQGNISQQALKKASGKNIKTIEKYYKLFKNEIAEIKQQFKQHKSGHLTPAQLPK